MNSLVCLLSFSLDEGTLEAQGQIAEEVPSREV